MSSLQLLLSRPVAQLSCIIYMLLLSDVKYVYMYFQMFLDLY